MSFIVTGYALAAGYNNIGGLTPFTSITDGTNTFVEPRGLMNTNRGKREIRTNGLVTRSGFPRVILNSALLYTQWIHVLNTYEGFVTVSLNFNSITVANYNAILEMDDSENMESVVFVGGFD